MDSIKIFCCYARKDRALQDQLVKHMEPLRRSGRVTTWYDRELLPGMEWKQEIDKHLNTSEIVLLLVSPNFMGSDYCYSTEMQKALERHERREAHVIPVILRPVNWKETPLGKLQALPTDGKPIVSWNDRDEAFRDVVEGIDLVVSFLQKTREDAFLSLNTQKARVSVEIDGKVIATYPLNKRSIVIGRGIDCDILVPSPHISRTQGIIRWVDGGWVITDAGAMHGLHYNGKFVHQHTFAHGDRVHFANVTIHFQLGSLI